MKTLFDVLNEARFAAPDYIDNPNDRYLVHKYHNKQQVFDLMGHDGSNKSYDIWRRAKRKVDLKQMDLTPDEVLTLYVNGYFAGKFNVKARTNKLPKYQKYLVDTLLQIVEPIRYNELYRIVDEKLLLSLCNGPIEIGSEWLDNFLCSTSSNIKGSFEVSDFNSRRQNYYLLMLHPKAKIEGIDIVDRVRNSNLKYDTVFHMYVTQYECLLAPTTHFRVTNIEENTDKKLKSVTKIIDCDIWQS